MIYKFNKFGNKQHLIFTGPIYEGTSNIQLNTIAKHLEQEMKDL